MGIFDFTVSLFISPGILLTHPTSGYAELALGACSLLFEVVSTVPCLMRQVCFSQSVVASVPAAFATVASVPAAFANFAAATVVGSFFVERWV